jgi:hypothetical protein
MKSPVIVLGMHRSGTTMLVNILEDLGFFFGAKKEINSESIFFQSLNEWIFAELNATWDNPYNFRFLNKKSKQKIVSVLQKKTIGINALNFLGFRFFLKYTDIRNIEIPWGWKDPRNTFTFDFWDELFPDAKVVHIYRNPIDVAESLRQRESKYQNEHKHCSLRAQNIYENIRLWKQYVNKALSLCRHTSNKILHLKFEDVASFPIEYAKNIIKFVESNENGTNSINFSIKVKKERIYAFKENKNLLEIYWRIKKMKLIKKLGYENI